MKKFLAILVAAFAFMTAFTGCDIDDEDDMYYTYSYWGTTVDKSVVDVIFGDIYKTNIDYAGTLNSTTGLYFFANNTKNKFDSRFDVLEENLDSTHPYPLAATNIKEFNDVVSDLLDYCGINSHQCGLIKDQCKKYKGLQIAIFKEDSTDTSKYDVVLLQLNEKNK